MKYLPHIGLPILMLLLIAGAIFLPQFVKKKEADDPDVSEMSYEEMRAVLVESGAIEDIPEPELEPSSGLNSVEETNPPEMAVRSGESAVTPPTAVSLDKELEPFFAAVEAGDFVGARETLATLGDKIPRGMVGGLKATIASAEASEKALAESAKQLEAKNAQLESARDRVSKIESESIQRIESSVKNLEAATVAAQKAAEEAAQLRVKIDEVTTMAAVAPAVARKKPVDKPTPPAAEKTPVNLPDGASITFGFDSSSIPSGMSSVIKTAIKELKKETGAKVQLRGHADKKGDAAYNAMLSKARAESVKDKLIEGGIDENRIEIISYGESQSGEENDPTKARRVDLVYRKR